MIPLFLCFAQGFFKFEAMVVMGSDVDNRLRIFLFLFSVGRRGKGISCIFLDIY